jgi:hypothetical protein
MKYLKNVLLAAGLVATTMGMSLSANAALIQQEIYVDVVEESFDDSFGITQSLNQLMGSVTYNTNDADSYGEIALDKISLIFNLGSLTFTEDDLLAGGSPPILLSADPEADGILSFIFDLFFTFDSADYSVLAIADTDFGGEFLLVNETTGSYDVFGETRLGAAVDVSEPSALILMLAGFGFLARRKLLAK